MRLGIVRFMMPVPRSASLRDRFRLGVVAYNPTVLPEEVEVWWIELAEAGEQHTVPHGPYWNLEGTRGIVQFIGEHHQDLWMAEVNLDSASLAVLTHDHDDCLDRWSIRAGQLPPAHLAGVAAGQPVCVCL